MPFVSALTPICVVVRLANARRRPRVPAIVATGTDALYQYWLVQWLVLLAWIFGSFSSSVVLMVVLFSWVVLHVPIKVI